MPMSHCQDRWYLNHQETQIFLEANIHSENCQGIDTAPMVEANSEVIHMPKRVWLVLAEITASKERPLQINLLQQHL